MSKSAAPEGRSLSRRAASFPDVAVRHAKQAVREAIREHRLLGNPIAVWRDGRVVLLHPDGSVTEPEPRDS